MPKDCRDKNSTVDTVTNGEQGPPFYQHHFGNPPTLIGALALHAANNIALTAPGRTPLTYQQLREDVRAIGAHLHLSLYQRHLKLDQVGKDDNFFVLGGDSIRATQIANRLQNLIPSLSIDQPEQVQPALRRVVESGLPACLNVYVDAEAPFENYLG